MTEEEYFRKNYPESCYGDKPLSPHWDFFQDGVGFGERQSEKKIEELENQSKTIIFLAQDKSVKGILSLSDKIKSNSKRTIEELHEMGVETYMLTGDNESSAREICQQAGIENFEANVCTNGMPSLLWLLRSWVW